MSRISTANREGTSVSHDSKRLSLDFTLRKMPAVAGPVPLKSFWTSPPPRGGAFFNVPPPREYPERVEAAWSGAAAQRGGGAAPPPDRTPASEGEGLHAG